MLAHIGCHHAVRRFTVGQLLQQQRRVDGLTGMVVTPGVLGAYRLVLTPCVDIQRLLQCRQQRVEIALQATCA
jgi:hypothetical protein